MADDDWPRPGRPRSVEPDIVCPHCGEDVAKWFGPRARREYVYFDLRLVMPANLLFVGGGDSMRLEPQLAEILAVLIEAKGRPMTTEQIMNRLGLWDAGPKLINVQMYKLRKLLDGKPWRAGVSARTPSAACLGRAFKSGGHRLTQRGEGYGG